MDASRTNRPHHLICLFPNCIAHFVTRENYFFEFRCLHVDGHKGQISSAIYEPAKQSFPFSFIQAVEAKGMREGVE